MSSFYSGTPPSSPSTIHFVIAGGSFAAITAVKVIAQKIIPAVTKYNPALSVHVTVIAPNKESFWNIAAPRLISQYDTLDLNTSQLFFNLKEAILQSFLHLSTKHTVSVITGKVISVNSEYNVITYMDLKDENEELTGFKEPTFKAIPINYDYLILATGTSSSSDAFKLNGTSENTKREIKRMADEIEKASSICIIGAGAVGVELAGEIGFKYSRQKKITLYSGVEGTFEYGKVRHSKRTLAKLKEVGVETILNVRAVSAHTEEEETVEYTTNPFFSSLDTPKKSSFWDYPEPLSSRKPVSQPQVSKKNSFPYIFSGLSASSNNITSSKSHSTRSVSTSPPSSPASSQDKRSTFFSQSSMFSNDDITSLSAAAGLAAVSRRRRKITRTLVTFDNGYRESFDCCIFATGNVPNSSFLPVTSLDKRGYVLTDAYLRMFHNNPNRNVYVFGDLVSQGKQTLLDITQTQMDVLKYTLLKDILGTPDVKLKPYQPASATYIVPISQKGGVGLLFGIPMPSFVIAALKSKDFMVDKSEQFLT